MCLNAEVLTYSIYVCNFGSFQCIISDGLTILVKGVCSRFEMAQELDRGEEDSSARLDAETVRGLLERLLPSLFKLIDTLHAKGATATDGTSDKGNLDISSRVHSVSEAIAAMARLCPASLLNTLSSKLIQRLLEASQSQEDHSVKVCSLLTLAQALVVSETLEESTISLLYRSLKPLIRTDETKPKVQKRAYKLLAEICSRYERFLSDRATFKELLELLTSTSSTSQTSARSVRLKCLSNLVKALDESEKQNKVRLGSVCLVIFSFRILAHQHFHSVCRRHWQVLLEKSFYASRTQIPKPVMLRTNSY